MNKDVFKAKKKFNFSKFLFIFIALSVNLKADGGREAVISNLSY